MNKYTALKHFNKYKDLIAVILILSVCYFLYCFGAVSGNGILDISSVVIASYGVLLVYFLGRKISSKKYGFISALILATCLKYIVVARVSVFDMLFCVSVVSAVYAGFYTLFCSQSHKKYFWWSAYIFAGCAFMTKGWYGISIPVLSLILTYIVAKEWKNIFRPLYFIPGIILFYLTILFTPVAHAPHNILPYYYIIPSFFIGFAPWIFSFVSQIIVYCKKSLNYTKMYFEKFNELQPIQRFMLVNVVFLFVSLIVSFILGAKFSGYILPSMFPAAMIVGKFWFDYLFKDENERALNISTLVLNFFVLALTGLLLMLPVVLKMVSPALPVILAMLLLSFVLLNTFSILKDKKILHFLAYVGLMLLYVVITVKFVVL